LFFTNSMFSFWSICFVLFSSCFLFHRPQDTVRGVQPCHSERGQRRHCRTVRVREVVLAAADLRPVGTSEGTRSKARKNRPGRHFFCPAGETSRQGSKDEGEGRPVFFDPLLARCRPVVDPLFFADPLLTRC
jgi:hypothetical protein